MFACLDASESADYSSRIKLRDSSVQLRRPLSMAFPGYPVLMTGNTSSIEKRVDNRQLGLQINSINIL